MGLGLGEKIMKRLLAVLLVLCCFLPCFAACNDNGGAADGGTADGTSTDNTPETEELKLEDVKIDGALSDYVIVYGNNETADLNKGLAEKLRDVIKTNCGVTLSIVMDNTVPTDKEILVGKTSRQESKIFFEGETALELMECVIGTVGSKVVVTGAMLFSTEEAILLVEKYAKENAKIDGMAAVEKNLHSGFTASKGEYRFMEYNVLVEYPGWGVEKVRNPEVEVRKEVVASMILGFSPDVVVLCEMFENWSRQLPALVDDEYTCVQWSRSATVSNRTPILYKTERFDLLESGYTDIAVVQSENYRVVTFAVLQDKQSNEKLVVFGTHFESTNETDRLAQVPKLKAAMDAVTARHSGATVVLMGDFNTAEYKTDNRAYAALESTLTSLKNPVKSHTFASIDQVFVSKTATVNKTHIEPNKYAPLASDHKPVIVDITTK